MELMALDEVFWLDLAHASIANLIINPITGNNVEKRIKNESEFEVEFELEGFIFLYESYVIAIFKLWFTKKNHSYIFHSFILIII